MANVKYLSLEGLERTIAHIRLRFGASLSTSASETEYNISLLNNDITPGVRATAVINGATTTSAGAMTAADKRNLDGLVANAVISVTGGTGITVERTDADTTVNLKPASTTEIGGIIVGSTGTSIKTYKSNGTNYYKVHTDINNTAFVALPTWSNNSGDITGVTAGNGLTGGATSGSATLNVGAGEGINVTADAVAIKAATDTALGGIKTGYTGEDEKTYAIKLDANNNAYVNVPWADIPDAIKNPNPISFTSGTFTGTPSYDGSAAQTIYVPTDITHLTRKSLTFGGKSFDGSADVTINKEDLGLSNALIYRGIASEAITEDSTTPTYKIGDTSYAATNGDVVFYEDFEFVWNGEKWERLGGNVNYKVVQDAVSDPNADGSTTAFIDTISQDSNGVITVTKKNVAFPDFPKLSTGTKASTEKNATVLGGITVSGHTVTAVTKTIVAGNNITIGTSTAGKIYINGTPDTTYTVSTPLAMASNNITLSYASTTSYTMLNATNTSVDTFADTNVDGSSIVTHNRLGLINDDTLCVEIDTITAYEIDRLFS